MACVQSACQQSIDVTDGKIMQCIMEMCREAEVLHTGSSRSSSWVHLNHWTIAWKMCRDSNYTKTWTLYHWRWTQDHREQRWNYTQQKHHVPPILSMTAPSTRPAQVSNTKTLLPAWMFARVNIWASVSYRRWLHYTKTHTHTVSKWIFHHTT